MNTYVKKQINGQRSYEHRFIIEEQLGRKLKTFEQVHHINGNRADNRPENLVYCKNIQEHRKLHDQWGRRSSEPCFCGRPSHGRNLCKNHYAQEFSKIQGW